MILSIGIFDKFWENIEKFQEKSYKTKSKTKMFKKSSITGKQKMNNFVKCSENVNFF